MTRCSCTSYLPGLFPVDPPARTTFECARLIRDARVGSRRVGWRREIRVVSLRIHPNRVHTRRQFSGRRKSHSRSSPRRAPPCPCSLAAVSRDAPHPPLVPTGGGGRGSRARDGRSPLPCVVINGRLRTSSIAATGVTRNSRQSGVARTTPGRVHHSSSRRPQPSTTATSVQNRGRRGFAPRIDAYGRRREGHTDSLLAAQPIRI